MRGADGSSSCVGDRNRSGRRANRHGRGHEFSIQHRERRANPVERHRSQAGLTSVARNGAPTVITRASGFGLRDRQNRWRCAAIHGRQ